MVDKTLNLAAIRWGVCAILERQRDMHTLKYILLSHDFFYRPSVSL